MKILISASLMMVISATAGCRGKGGGEIESMSEVYQMCEQRHLLTQEYNTRYFQSCSEVDSNLSDIRNYHSCVAEGRRKIQSRGPQVYASDSPKSADAVGAADASASSSVDILTNLRESGVDEPDFVKVSAEQIFVAKSQNEIQVIERKSRTLTGVLSISPDIEKHSDDPSGLRYSSFGSGRSFSHSKPEMFVSGERLVVLNGSSISLYQTRANELPIKLRSQVWPGQIVQSRLSGGKLILLTSEYFSAHEDSNLKFSGDDCGAIVRPAHKLDLTSGQLMRIASISLEDLSNVDQTVVLGDQKIYMTNKSIYLYDNTPRWIQQKSSQATLVKKIGIEADGRLRDVIQGTVKGRIKDVWALSELPTGELAVASSTGQLWNDSARNHFEIFAEKNHRLERISQTEDYGAKEDIRSVRFVGSMAYVVTFKKTDPLYAIDVSNPHDPRILGELKIPGFSTYMHPLAESRLIGLGFDALDMGDFALYQGLQVSLFDTQDPTQMRRLDVDILGARGSSSAATTDHRAFFMDQSEALFGFPISEIKDCSNQFDCVSRPVAMRPSPEVDYSSRNFSGAVLYKVQGDELSDALRVTHADLMSDSCFRSSLPMSQWWENSVSSPDIQRIFKLAGEIVTVSQGALKTFKLTNGLEQTGAVRWASDCDR